MAKSICDIVVVGGGIVGLAIGCRLQSAGRQVLLIDKDEPGRGCSFGNAGVIATSYVLPLSSLGQILKVPRMLADPLGPLSIRAADLPHITPWLARFAFNALPERRRKSTRALKALNEAALEAWRRLLGDCRTSDLLIEKGMIDIVRNTGALPALDASAAALRRQGVRIERLDAEAVGELEPALGGRTAGGMYHCDVAHVADPFAVSQALLSTFRARGGRVESGRVLALAAGEDDVRVRTQIGEIAARHVVVAAGLWSAPLLEGLGAKAPIGAERGYHLMLPCSEVRPSRPISFHQESFIATPMLGGLRFSGTVELAKPETEPNWKRADQLLTLGRRYLAGLTDEDASHWMGCRPSFPDSLPAVGRLGKVPRLFYAFGHQHLGLTQAAITAECIDALVHDRAPPISLADLSLDRFS